MPRKPTGTKGGPQTQSGKAITARNALSHGLTSLAPVIAGVESTELWERHAAGVRQSLAPEGHLEEVLTERIATLLWRIQRVVRFESETVSRAQPVVESVPPGQITVDNTETAREWQPAHTYISWAGLAHFVKQLPGLANQTPININAVSVLLHAVARHAGASDPCEWLAAVLHPRVILAGNLPANKLREAIQEIAASADTTSETLLQAISAEAEIVVEQKRQADLASVRHTRILPHASDLDKIMRYEAHLNRLLLSTFHELEALQERRLGHPAPLARIDITTDTQT